MYYHLQVFVKPALSKLDYAIARQWSVYGYVAAGRRGAVVAPAFAGRTLVFGLVENVVQF